MYKKVENQWLPIEGDFKQETAKSKTEMVSLFSLKINNISWMAPIYGGNCLHPGDMVWAYYLCMSRKEPSYIVMTERSIDTECVSADPQYIREVVKHSENAVIRGFYYFKRTGSRAVMQELTFEEMQEICK